MGIVELTQPEKNIGDFSTMPALMTLPTRHEGVKAESLLVVLEAYYDTKRPVLTSRTEQNYRNHLGPFVQYWQNFPARHNYTLSAETIQDFRKWFETEFRNIYGRRAAYNTIAHCFTRLHQFFSWCYKNNCTGTVNVCDWLPSVPKVAPDLYFPPISEFSLMFRTVDDERYRVRDRTVMAFLLSTAARLHETAEAKIENINFINSDPGNIRLGDDHRGWVKLEVVKGNMGGLTPGRNVVFCSKCGLLIKGYLLTIGRSSGKIFDMSDKGLSLVIARHRQLAKLPEISPHAFRRAFSDYWMQHQSHLMRALKMQMGHSLVNGDVTEKHYVNPRNSRGIVEEILKCHISPLREIDIDWSKFPVYIP